MTGVEYLQAEDEPSGKVLAWVTPIVALKMTSFQSTESVFFYSEISMVPAQGDMEVSEVLHLKKKK
jgi:hypothetical protein